MDSKFPFDNKGALTRGYLCDFSKLLSLILFLSKSIFFHSASATPKQTGLNPNKLLTQYIIDSWTTDNGLVNNGILDIEKTNDGYLWIATYGGLVRFDGAMFMEFPELKNLNGIRSLLEDSRGNLWIGSDDGALVKYKDEQFTFLEIDTPVINSVITAIAEDRDGKIWVGTRSGMAVVNNNRLQRFNHPLLSQALIYGVEIDDLNNIWIATSGLGLFKYSEGVIEQFTIKEGLINNSIRSIHIDKKGNLLIGSEGGLTQFENGTPSKSYSTKNGLPHNYINEILEDSRGTIWLGTDDGLVRFRNDQFEVLNQENGLTNNTIEAIYEDTDGILWVGTYYGGLNRLIDGKFINFGLLEGLNNELVYVVHTDETKIWIGSANGLSCLQHGVISSFQLGHESPINKIKDIMRDSGGRMWIGTSGGLINYQNGEIAKIVTTQQGLSNNRVRRIVEAPNGDLWIGTAKGLNRYNIQSGTCKLYGFEEGLKNEFILSLFVDTQNRTWAGTNGGGSFY